MTSAKFNIPTVIVVYGATGDLMARKITPALFNLYLKNRLPPMFRVIGVSRRTIKNEEFRTHIRGLLKSHPSVRGHKKEAEAFSRMFYYVPGEFSNQNDYQTLATEMGRIDGAWNVCSNKLFYLAVPPEYFKQIFTHLHKTGLTEPCSPEEGWTRVLVEKPFGRDYKTAQELERILSKLFKEEQIYRIDHYLGKDMLQNILAFRFGNNFLEESWSNKHIERIDIRLIESIDASKRGAFYDSLGALKDVGQNHLLQMMALVTMDNPVSLTASAIRTKRAELLQSLVPPDAQSIRTATMRAQYQGYRRHTGVARDSDIETYFKVRASLANSRWEGVPIYLSSGKNFSKPQKDITITFRNPQQCLTCEPGEDYQNQVIFSLEPEEKISIKFFSKKPGLTLDIQQKDLQFMYRSAKERTQYVEEYEKLLLDCILGDQTLFVSTPEVEPMWQWTDAIVAGWRKGMVPLRTYKPDNDQILEEKLPEENGDGHERLFKKEIAIVGLGKMGKGIALQLMDRGWRVHGYNRTASVTQALERQGLHGLSDLSAIATLRRPRVVWIMVPAGLAVDEVLFGTKNRHAEHTVTSSDKKQIPDQVRDDTSKGLIDILEKGDIVIDAGNSHYTDSLRRAKQLEKKDIRFVDVGVSGGPKGARFGACIMVGGDEKTFKLLEELYFDISVPRGYAHFEGAGAGHFVKMVHNGIEYGMMQAIGEGFAVMRKAPYKLDLPTIAGIYNRGSVVESRLIGWLKDAYDQLGSNLEKVSGSVAHSGEGKWTVEAAKKLKVDTKIIEGAFQFRLDSEKKPSYTGKVVSALRGQFGGHAVKK